MPVVLVALRVLLGSGAVALVVATVLSAVRTFILPRAANTFLARLVFVAIRTGFDGVVRRLDSYERQDAVMALFAPAGLRTLPVAWISLVLTACAAADRAMAPSDGLVTAIDERGSALFTLASGRRSTSPPGC
jgi:hypothetical protein